MKRNINVAVIGLSSLESFAVKEIIKRFPATSIESYPSFALFLPSSQGFETIVCDEQTYLLNPDFFLPRKGHTIVVFSKSAPADIKEKKVELPYMIFPDTDEIAFHKTLKDAITFNSEDRIPEELSTREKEVIKLIAKGLSNKEIADELSISVNTAITHRKNISTKLGIKSASGMSLYALMAGII